METRVRLVIQSHLSYAMMIMESNPSLAQERLRFVKYLVHHYSNTQQLIFVDWVYEQFKKFDNK
tara:strand:+ start:338 stop:529 length:192 start_codon:yes stop_codon:yes gene_type:complete